MKRVNSITVKEAEEYLLAAQRLTVTNGNFKAKDILAMKVRGTTQFNIVAQRLGLVTRNADDTAYIFAAGNITRQMMEDMLNAYRQYNKEHDDKQKAKKAAKQLQQEVRAVAKARKKASSKVIKKVVKATLWDRLLGRAKLVDQLHSIEQKLDRLIKNGTER